MASWINTTLDEVCLKITDGSHRSPKSVVNGFLMASVKDMTENGFNFETCRLISHDEYRNLVKNDCKPIKDDVLIAKDGSYLKHVFVWNNNIDLVILSSIAILRPNKYKINPYYLAKYLSSPSVKKAMSGYVSGVALPRIILKDFKKFEIKIPPLKTQQRIASILEAYDDLIENNTRRIKILEEMAKRIYKQWFVDFKFPGHEKTKFVNSPLGKIPMGWEVINLSYYGKVITGKTPSKKKPENFGNFMPFIKTPDMHNNIFCISTNEGLSEIGVKSQLNKIIPENSLCVSCIGTAGVVTITSQPSQTNQQINSIIPKFENYREYLYYTLVGLKQTIEQYGSNGATMVNLNKGKFEALKVLLPNKILLDEFTNLAKPIFDNIKKLQIKNNVTVHRNNG